MSESQVQPILIGKGEAQRFLLPGYGNRHGLITGATGTGKTVTLQILAEGFSKLGVPVFLADVKGDLAGLSQPANPHPEVDRRIDVIGIEGYSAQGSPVRFWDLFGQRGHPIRTTVSEMGPLLLASLLELNDTQEGVLNIAFRIADEQGLLLLDLEDLRALLRFVGEDRETISIEYGNVATASVAAIQRRLLVLDNQGAEQFFGEPALALGDLMQSDEDGHGMINVLAADKLIHNPRLYATFLLWLLAELFEELPEVGDPDKPELVFFFDEAHLLFDNAPEALIDQVEQVVRLIRSKGVGVFFITQNPLDVPDTVLSQLGNRIQHALRAYTPREQKAVRAAASSFRQNPNLDTETVITELGVGEALVSMLEDKGIPAVADRALIRPPESRIGPITDTERKKILKASSLAETYDESVDRESAAEMLEQRAWEAAKAAEKSDKEPVRHTEKPGTSRKRQTKSGSWQKTLQEVLKFGRSRTGQRIIRGVFGALFKGR